ncbi:transglycosylase SLT domain-containing protein [Kocuria sp. JC486]|uniref:transglycosylase SLT domain-containing protein n=1 Tax=Kocuria sp. JC486 TaxID=1970736 RepID=UPI00141E074C|nr:lytic transglycosylase domain-containing protein [Kocuria sp. JC486]NHU85827.1 transglycosylase SLT domain-containing protein [Kocuria sp. JC486]
MSASSAKSPKRAKSTKSATSRRSRTPGSKGASAGRAGKARGALTNNWLPFTAVGLLVIGAVGAVIQNTNPTCADRNGVIPEDWSDDVVNAAEISGFSPSVIAAQIQTESNWDPEAESPVGAEGLAQFMPETWDQYGQGEATSPEASIAAQGHYLRDLRRMMAQLEPADEQEELDLVLAAYNAGPTAVLEEGGVPEFEETENYVSQINELAGTRYADVCTG